jgi:predicted nucleotidyltransferase
VEAMIKVPKVRLEQFAIEAILETFRQYFHKSDRLWLFGSRADMNRKGGDIDLYIETSHKDADSVFDAKLSFLSDLKAKIGDQKIDVVVKFNDFNLPIHKIAKEEGVRLV